MSTIQIETLKQSTPSVFATKPASKLSEKYTFVPTVEIIENFDREGWKVYSASQIGKGTYSAHQLRLRNGDMPKVGDCFLEAILRNSHNGTQKLNFSAGLHRLVCSNGLTVPTSISASISIKHMSINLDDVRRITEEFAQRLPIIDASVRKMQNTFLNDSQTIDFVTRASLLRWDGGTLPSETLAQEILQPLREEDNGNSTWQIFNVIQEKFVRGGLKIPSKTGRVTTTRELKNFNKINNINSELWELAESYC